MAAPAARITNVASGCLINASFRSMRLTVESAPGEPKPAAVLRVSRGRAEGSLPTAAPSGMASKL
jgi:hypothetical protein